MLCGWAHKIISKQFVCLPGINMKMVKDISELIFIGACTLCVCWPFLSRRRERGQTWYDTRESEAELFDIFTAWPNCLINSCAAGVISKSDAINFPSVYNLPQIYECVCARALIIIDACATAPNYIFSPPRHVNHAIIYMYSARAVCVSTKFIA